MNKQTDPLHGVTLKAMLEALVEKIGFEAMSKKVRINCFRDSPSIKSSLTFLRRTPWAREEVEGLYLQVICKQPLPPKPRTEQASKTAAKVSSKGKTSAPLSVDPWAKSRKS